MENNGGCTPLHLAAQKRHNVTGIGTLTIGGGSSRLERLRTFLSSDLDAQTRLQTQTSRIRTDMALLGFAPIFGNDKALESLFRHRADVDAKSRVDVDTYELANPNSAGGGKNNLPGGTRPTNNTLGRSSSRIHAKLTSLHLAALVRREDKIRILLNEKADANAELTVNIENGQFKLTSLYISAIWGRKELVQPLLDGGANLQAKPNVTRAGQPRTEFSVLQLAIRSENAELVRLLLNRGAELQDVSQINVGNVTYTFTALHLAVMFKREEIASWLLNHGVDVHTRCSIKCKQHHFKLSALHCAVPVKNEKLVQALIKKGVSVNESCMIDQNINNTLTALHLAARLGTEGIMRQLLVDGANISTLRHIMAYHGPVVHLTVLQIAAIWGHMNIMPLLHEHGGSLNGKGIIRCSRARIEASLLHIAVLVNSSLPRESTELSTRFPRSRSFSALLPVERSQTSLLPRVTRAPNPLFHPPRLCLGARSPLSTRDSRRLYLCLLFILMQPIFR